MKLCVVSIKECWQDSSGKWFSTGGFPFQMQAISSLFDEVELVVLQDKAQPGGVPLPEKVRVTPLMLPKGKGFSRKVSVAILLPYYLAKIGPVSARSDVIHIPLPGDISLIGLLTGLAMRKHIIARYGGSWEETAITTFMNRVTKGIMRQFAGGRNVMIATGMGDTPPAHKMHWLFVSVISKNELASIKPDLSRLPGRPLKIIFAGRLSPEKGIPVLLQALRILKNKGSFSPFHLRLIGDGPQRAQLETMVQVENLSEEVTFCGQMPRPALLEQMLEMDVCVLPSLTESFCKARLDAYLCGVPVITTAVGFGREIIGEDGERGWILPASEAQALAAVLKRAISITNDWPSLRKRCRQYAEQFSLEQWAEAIAGICAEQWNIPSLGGKIQA